jgi:hypothetical protein
MNRGRDERREGLVGTKPLCRGDWGTDGELARPVIPWECWALPPAPIGRISAAIAVCLLFGGLAWGGDSDTGAGVTLQNEKIFCWGRSFEMGEGAHRGETYPEHLARILGREVDQSEFQFMQWSRSDMSLDDVSYFDEHKYGVVTMRTNKDGPAFPWNETEANLRELVRRLQGTGAVVVMFETGTLWDLDGQMTTTDEECLTNTSQYVLEGVENPEFVCTTIGGKTQTADYYELWGDTVFCKMAEEEDAYFIPEYVLDCLEEGEEACPRITKLHPDLECDDDYHPNDIGYGVLAERMAEYLVGWGLADYAVDLDRLSQDLPGDFARAEGMIKTLEERNHPMGEELEKEYRMAKFVYEHGYLYTANRTLVGTVLPLVSSVYDNWDEVQAMFVQAAECIETLRQAGDTRNEKMCSAFYAQAESVWAEYDYVAAHTKLGNMIAKCPETAQPALLSLLVVSFLLYGIGRNVHSG